MFNKKYPLLHGFANFEPSEHHYRQHAEYLKDRETVVPNCSLYLNGQLHDSWVESVTYEEKRLTLCLNEFQSHCLCDALVEQCGPPIPHAARTTPLVLTFEDVQQCSVSRINHNGKIIPIETSRYLPRLTEFLLDEVLEIQPDRIRMGLWFWTNCPGDRRELLLEVRSGSLVIEEGQREAFQGLFEGEHAGLIDAFWDELHKGVRFDASVAHEFVTARMREAK